MYIFPDLPGISCTVPGYVRYLHSTLPYKGSSESFSNSCRTPGCSSAMIIENHERRISRSSNFAFLEFLHCADLQFLKSKQKCLSEEIMS